jgi:hypothetical protein
MNLWQQVFLSERLAAGSEELLQKSSLQPVESPVQA